jgi:hypothetical protein
MAPTIEVDEGTFRSLEFAARIAGTTPGGIVARLVETASTPADRPEISTELAVFADYEGHRTHARYDRTTGRVDITSGPLGGQSFKTPTGAARAVVAHYNADVSSNRNGWTFWTLDDDSGEILDTVRQSKRAAAASGSDGGPSKYDPLKKHLAERSEPVVSLSFGEIERILGFSLPPSARKHRAFWANGGHLIASAWLDAGRRMTHVDLNAEAVDFGLR